MPALALSAAVVFAGCGGGSATIAPTGAAVTPAAVTPAAGTLAAVTPAAVTPAAVTPAAVTPAAVTPVAGTPVAGTPAAPPSFTPDFTLAAKFPAAIDGQPVTNVQTALYIDFLRQFGSTADEVQKAIDVFSAMGLDFTRMSFGSGSATVDGTSVGLIALRTPDADANKIVQNYALIAGALDASPPPAPTMTQLSIGGKNVTRAVDSAGKATVLYVTGDTLFLIQDTTDSQTTKILQALP
jgi:hypothetical protein